MYVLLAVALSLTYSIVMYHLSTGEINEALERQLQFINEAGYALPPNMQYIEQHSQHLFIELVWFNIFVVAGATIFGYFLARRTLRPIRVAHQAQVRFTAEASHELRTPLAAMRADTEVALMDKKVTGKARKTLQENLADIERLEQLTSQLLDIARYQNNVAIPFEVVDFDDVVLRVVRMLKKTLQTKNIKLDTHIVPVQIMGDVRTLEQLVTIVLDNAVKYSHQSGTIRISLKTIGDAAMLEIKDWGIGILKEDLGHVFEHFYRSKNARTFHETSGYGLGLPLAQEIVSVHGGHIKLDSQVQKGTTVTITIPQLKK